MQVSILSQFDVYLGLVQKSVVQKMNNSRLTY